MYTTYELHSKNKRGNKAYLAVVYINGVEFRSYVLAGKYLAGMGVAGVLGCAFWYGYGYTTDVPVINRNQPKAVGEEKSVHNVSKETETEQPAKLPPVVEKTEKRARGMVINGDREEVSFLQYVWMSLLFLPVGYWVFSRRPDVFVKDSEAFNNALDAWSKVVFMKHHTPRL